MSRNFNRLSGRAYSLSVHKVNGDASEALCKASIVVENISKGGFRFLCSAALDLEDRVHATLSFPDGSTHNVFGRICYREIVESDEYIAYGFSIIEGFYKLESVA
jgi:hypothetical protein